MGAVGEESHFGVVGFPAKRGLDLPLFSFIRSASQGLIKS